MTEGATGLARTPPGQEEYFLAVGDLLPDRTLTPAEKTERVQPARALAAKYRTEFVS